MASISTAITRFLNSNDHDRGIAANELSDYYREGESLLSLIPLLTSDDANVAENAAWIASEIVDGRRGHEILEYLTPLLKSPNPRIRFWAIESVALLADYAETTAIVDLLHLLIDANQGVREQALVWICWISDEAVARAVSNNLAIQHARLLLRDSSKYDIVSSIQSESLFAQRIAIASAMRNYGDDELYIEKIQHFLDDEVKGCFGRLPKVREFAN